MIIQLTNVQRVPIVISQIIPVDTLKIRHPNVTPIIASGKNNGRRVSASDNLHCIAPFAKMLYN